MLANYILISLRNLSRNKTFILINLLGMGTAIACCIVAYLNWNFAASFDSMHVNSEDVYRIQATYNTPDGNSRYAVVPTALGPIISENIAKATHVVRYAAASGDFRIGDETFHTTLAYADASFLNFFTFEFIDGSSAALRDKRQIIISETLALKYFNDIHISGRTVTQLFEGKTSEFIIGGVFADQPLNSSFAFDALVPWSNYQNTPGRLADVDNSWSDMTMIFVRIEDESAIGQVEAQLQGYLKQQHDARDDFRLTSFYLQPFRTLAASFHGDTWLNGEQLRWGVPPSSIIGPAVMAAFLLLLACFNFTNTSLAISARRLKEIGVRKVMGGVRAQLITQFLSESAVMCLLSCVIAIAIAAILVPMYNSLWPGIKLSADVSSDAFFFIFLLLLVFATALVAGAYPALYVTAFRPAAILKGKLNLAGTNWFTRILLTLQFSIALLCVVAALAFFRNAAFQRNYDLGYIKEGVITCPVSGSAQYEKFRNLLLMNKDVTVIAGSRTHVSDRYDKGTVKYQSDEHQVEIVEAGDNYLQAMGVEVVSGRDFHKDASASEYSSVIVSEKFVKQFAWQDDALGKTIIWRDTIHLHVVGVVRDIHTDGYWKPVAPVMIRHVPADQYEQLVVRTSADKVVPVNDAMRESWKQVSPNTVYAGRFTDGNISTAKMINDNTVRIFGFLGAVALLMSTTGLYALLTMNIARRTKEIGIRKIMGAPAAVIVRLISAEFFCILLIASALGGSLGYLSSQKVMDLIWEYYERMSINTLIVAALCMFGVAIVSVGWKTYASARMNPAEALKQE